MTKPNTGADPRFQRSFEALIEAISALADAEPLPTLTIKRIADAAGVSRPTFYQHAADVNDLARKAAVVRLAGALTEPPDFTRLEAVDFAHVSAEFSQHLLPLLDHLESRRAFYRNVLDHAGSPDLFAELTSMMAARVNLEPFRSQGAVAAIDSHALSEVITGGLMWRVVGWIRSDGARMAPDAKAREIGALAASLICGSATR